MEVNINKETVTIELTKKDTVLLLASIGTIDGLVQHKILQNYTEDLPKFITLENKTEWLNEELELKELQQFLHNASESLLTNINDSKESNNETKN